MLLLLPKVEVWNSERVNPRSQKNAITQGLQAALLLERGAGHLCEARRRCLENGGK
eukprot:COSAG01_NODE_5761_length_4048_cov_8.447962_3_plen_56_part_00